MSYKVVVTAIGEATPSYNALRFETSEEADGYGYDLMCRWFGMDSYKIEESDEPVTYRFQNQTLERIDDNDKVKDLGDHKFPKPSNLEDIHRAIKGEQG